MRATTQYRRTYGLFWIKEEGESIKIETRPLVDLDVRASLGCLGCGGVPVGVTVGAALESWLVENGTESALSFDNHLPESQYIYGGIW